MSSAKSQRATEILWISPTGHKKLLVPSGGSLEASVENGAITIRGNNCIQKSFGLAGSPDVEVKMSQVHITISLAHCEITWAA